MAVLTSKLILELIDRVTGPSRAVAASVNRLTALQNKNAAMMADTSRKLLVASAAAYGLAKSLQAPVSAAASFETALLNIGQKADMSDESIAAMGKRIRALAPIVNQSALEVAKGVDALVGFGLDSGQAETLMGPIGRAATAYQASIDDLSKAGFSALDNLKVKANDFGKALDVMAQSGKEGAFEIKDMAAHFPELTAAASGLGMTGITAVGRLSAALQIARKGAGDSAKAATNTANLMQKIISPETTTKFKKAGIDIRKELKKTQKAGGDIFEMIDTQLKKATKGDQSKIGDFFQDSEVQKFLRALWQNTEEYKKIRDKALGANGVVDKDFARRMKTNAAQTEAFKIQVNDLSMTIGNILLPSVNKIMAALKPAIKSFERFAEANPRLMTGLTAVAGGLLGIRVAALLAKLAVGGAKQALLELAKRGLLAVGTAAGFAGVLLVGTALLAYYHWDDLLKLWEKLRAPWPKLREEISKTRAMMAKPWADLHGNMKKTGENIAGPWGNIGEKLASTKALITGAFEGLGDKIAETWSKISEPMVQAIADLGAKIKAGASVLYDAGVVLITNLWEGMKATVSRLLGWAGSIGSKIKSAISGGTSAAAAVAPGGSGGIGARAAGGPVARGVTYLVGENGPELFRAPTSGAISSTADTVRMLKENALAGAAGRSGGTRSLNAPITINVNGAPGQSVEAIADAVERKFSAKLAQLSRGAYSDGVN